MTTPPDTGARTSTGAPAAPGIAPVTGILAGHLVFYLLIWLLIGAVLFAINLIGAGVWGDVDGSGWDGQVNVFQYAMLAGGIVVAAGYLPAIVTNGVTRRVAADGGLVVLVLLAVVAAVLTTLVFGIEDVIFSINDWPHVLSGSEEEHLYDQPDQYGLILVDVFARYLTHTLAGLVIGLGVYRFGWLWGGPFILAGAALAIVAEYLVGSGVLGVALGRAVDLEPPPVGVAIAGTVVVAVVAALTARRLAQAMPVLIGRASWWR